jgi:hypothetical protein
MLITDEVKIAVADRLLKSGYITEQTRALLITEGGTIVDDTQFPVEISEDGSVYINVSGSAWPLIFKGYIQKHINVD